MVSSPQLARRSLLLGAGATALTGCMAPGPDGVADFTHLNIPVQTDIAYGDHPQQRLDVYPAATSRRGTVLPRRPAVVFFHGGFWQFGSRTEAPVQTICSHLAARGITAVAAGYRLYPETSHQGILEDAAQVVAWAIRNGEDHGAARGRVVASGHSAGGWMSAMLHVRPQLVHQALGVSESDRHPLAGTVGVAGPYAHWPTRFPLLFNLFDGVPTEQRLPNTYVSGHLPPSLLVQGMLDTIVWPPNAFFFARDLERAGNRSRTSYYMREHMTVMPVVGLLPGSLALVDDIEAFVKGPEVMAA
jgi:acetyl esterase/lipase